MTTVGVVQQKPQPQRQRRQPQRQQQRKVVPPRRQVVHVDVIIPVHNAESTIEDAVHSAMNQQIPPPPPPPPPMPSARDGGGGDGGDRSSSSSSSRSSSKSRSSSSRSSKRQQKDGIFECFRLCSDRDKDPTNQSNQHHQQHHHRQHLLHHHHRHQTEQKEQKQKQKPKTPEDDADRAINADESHHHDDDDDDDEDLHQQQQEEERRRKRCFLDDDDDDAEHQYQDQDQDHDHHDQQDPHLHGQDVDDDDVDVHDCYYDGIYYWYDLSISVCCYDDGSTDSSLEILQRLQRQKKTNNNKDMDKRDTVEKTKDISTENDTKSDDAMYETNNGATSIPSRLLVDSSSWSSSSPSSSSSHGRKSVENGGHHLQVAAAPRGAGYARNRAIEMNDPHGHGGRRRRRRRRCDDSNESEKQASNNDDGYKTNKNETETEFEAGTVKEEEEDDDDDEECIRFLCWLDSDDIMHPYRVAYQTLYMLKLKLKDEQHQMQQQQRQVQHQMPSHKQNSTNRDDNFSSSSTTTTTATSSSSRTSSLPSVSLMDRTLLGTTFQRDPPDSTWHYTDWANNRLLVNYNKHGTGQNNNNNNNNSRLMLERFREVTVIQPTWFMSRKRWNEIGPYVEAPPAPPSPPPSQPSATAAVLTPSSQQQQNQETSQSDRSITIPSPSASTSTVSVIQDVIDKYKSDYGHKKGSYCLIHPTFETSVETLKLAEDLRLFYSHLKNYGTIDIVTHKRQQTSGAENTEDKEDEDTSESHRLQSPEPLVTYRQLNPNGSQSFRTSRRLILALRCKAFQDLVLRPDNTDWWRSHSSHSSLSSSSSSSPSEDHHHEEDQKFVIWGAGRDGKDFFKMLDETNKKKVYCFVDVDIKKLRSGYYVDHYTSSKANCSITNGKDRRDSNTNKPLRKNDNTKDNQKNKKKGHKYKIPIVHFSYLASSKETRQRLQDEFVNGGAARDAFFGRINKSRHTKTNASDNSPSSKRAKTIPEALSTPRLSQTNSSPSQSTSASFVALNDRKLDLKLLQTLPVVVCVAMYRTNGVLEQNVSAMGRVEGKTLWHFS